MNKSSHQKLSVYILIILVGVILFIIAKQYYEQEQIKKYTGRTSGKIIEISHLKNIDYSLKYEYYVDDVRYEGNIGVGYFECEDGNQGCVGTNFPVFYSVKNPEYSIINLLEYERFQETVKF